jgi:hypothetical protein
VLGSVIDLKSHRILDTKPIEEWAAMGFPTKKRLLETPNGLIGCVNVLFLTNEDGTERKHAFFVTDYESVTPKVV